MKSSWLTILNPYAGSGKTMSVWVKAEALLRSHNVSFVSRSTESGHNVRTLALLAAREGYRRIMGVGGDGTVHDIVHGILDFLTETPGARLDEFTIAVIPLGSGNDWLKSLGIKHKDLNSVIETIAKGRARCQDVGKITLLESGETFPIVNIAGVGFDARICEIVNDEKKHGITRKSIYLQAVLRMLSAYKGMDVCIKIDGVTVHKGPCYTISIGNGTYSGGGLRQTPDALMDDGLLDISFVPRITFGLVVKVLPQLLGSTFNKNEGVVTGRGKVIEISPLNQDSAESVESDGEVLGHIPARFELLDGQLNVIA